MKNIAILFSLLLFGNVGFAQNFTRFAPYTEQALYVGSTVDVAIQPDGSMAFSTFNHSFGHVVFRSPDGVLTNSGIYKCGNDIPTVRRILPHPDGGYYLVGYHQHFMDEPLCPNFHFDTLNMSATPDIWVLRIDATGVVIWAQSVGGSKQDGMNDAVVCQDGGLAIFGHTNSNDGDISNTDNPPNGFFNAPWMARLSPEGDVLWDFQAPWTLSSSNYIFNGLELSDGNFMVFSVETNGYVEAYKLSPDGEELAHYTVLLPVLVQGFNRVLPYGTDKIVLGGTGEMVPGSFNRAAYLLVIDTDGNKLGDKFLPDSFQDHYFEAMFIDDDEVIVAGSFYDYDFVSFAALQLPGLAVNSYQKFQSSAVPYVRNVFKIDDNTIGVQTNIESDYAFQWMQGNGSLQGYVEFKECDLTPDFTWQNTDNNTVQFSNNSGSGAIDFTWDFQGLGSSFSENPSFTFPSTGTYNVCLSVANQLLCTADICQQITVGQTSTENPFFENVRISTTENKVTIAGLEKKSALEIYNADGRLMKKEIATKGLYHTDISALPTGIYFLVLKNEMGLKTVRFVQFAF